MATPGTLPVVAGSRSRSVMERTRRLPLRASATVGNLWSRRQCERRPRSFSIALHLGWFFTLVLVLAGYDLLSSINVFEVVLGFQPLFDPTNLTIMMIAAIALFIAVVFAIHALSTAVSKKAPTVLLMALLLLPGPLTIWALTMGGNEAVDNNLAIVNNYVSRVDADSLSGVYETARGFGVSLPGEEALLNALKTAKKAAGGD